MGLNRDSPPPHPSFGFSSEATFEGLPTEVQEIIMHFFPYGILVMADVHHRMILCTPPTRPLACPV